MPTLLTINNYHYRRGGAEVAYFAQSELFEKRGWNVASFSMAHHENLTSPWSKYFANEIEYGHHYSWFRTVKNAANSIYSLEAAKKIRQLVRQFRPNIAHAHNIYHHLSPSILRAVKKEGVPTFMTLHDVKLLCPARTMWTGGNVCEACKGGKLHNVIRKNCMKGSLALSTLIYSESMLHQNLQLYRRSIDRFISPSRFVMSKFIEWGWPADHFAYIPNFVEASEYVPNYAAGRHFLYFGRLSGEKGVATLIRAVQLAGLPLRIVGAGPESSALQALAHSINADVSFLGYMSGDDLWNEVRSARAIVLPSEWYENAPISLLEAYAMGKPVVGARIGGIPELIREGETGSLHKSGDVADLAHSLENIANMPDKSVEAWGRQARAWVADEFSSSQYYRRLRELYAEYCRDIR